MPIYRYTLQVKAMFSMTSYIVKKLTNGHLSKCRHCIYNHYNRNFLNFKTHNEIYIYIKKNNPPDKGITLWVSCFWIYKHSNRLECLNIFFTITDYSETCLNWIVNDTDYCINQTLNNLKSKSRKSLSI